MRKKRFGMLLVVAALVITLAAEAFFVPMVSAKAAESSEDTVTVTKTALKNAKLSTKVYVNGTKLKKKGFYVSGKVNGKKETIYYVSAKLFAKALGGKYSVKGKNVTITLEGFKVDFTIGKDGYAASVTEGLGAMAPVSKGRSYKKGSYVYIPVNVFASLCEGLLNNKVEINASKKKLSFDLVQETEGDLTWFVDERFTKTKSSEVTSEAMAAFELAIKDYQDDAEIKPVALLATADIMSTMNYALCCRYSKEGENTVYALAVVNVMPTGTASIIELKKIPDFVSHVSTAPVTGGWGEPSSVVIDSKMKVAFDMTLGMTDGAVYTPVAILESQVVAGMNYCVLCESEIIYPDAVKTYALVYIYVDLKGNAEVTDIKVYVQEDPAVEDVDYKHLRGNAFEALTVKGLKYIINDDESTLDNLAIISSDFVIDERVSSMGSVQIQKGANVTIKAGGALQANLDIDEGATVTVEKGGIFATTMGAQFINQGTIIVKDGGILFSTMGTDITNASKGKITLDGTFACGCVSYGGQTHIWFINEGKFEGKGTIVLYNAGDDPTMFEPTDLDACKAEIESIIGKDSSITVITTDNIDIQF